MEEQDAVMLKKKFKKVEGNVLKILNNLGYDAHLTEYEREHYDIYGTTPKKESFFLEVKDRNVKYDDWIMEVYKAESMVKDASKVQEDVKLIYVCVYENTYYFYDVNDAIELNKIEKKWCPISSIPGYNGYGRKEKKDCYMIPIDSSIKIIEFDENI